MAEHKRTVRVTFDADVSFDAEEGMPESVLREIAANLALGFVDRSNLELEFPVGKPVSVGVSAVLSDDEYLPTPELDGQVGEDGLFEADVTVTRYGGDYAIYEAYQVGNRD